MSHSLSRMQAIILGAVVLAGLSLGAAGLFAVGSREWLWQDSFHVRVAFRQILGVEPGTRVRVLGKDAGEVDAVELPAHPTGEVVLRLRLDGQLRSLIRSDASAQIVPEGMVGGRVLEIEPGSDRASAVADGALIASRPTTSLTDVLGDVGARLKEIAAGRGSVGRLLQNDDAYQELVNLLHQSRGAMASVRQNADAVKGLPVVRSFIQDPYRLLVRPECERQMRWFTELDLFEPGRAVLTPYGRQRLDETAAWLNGIHQKNSEVVVAAYADPSAEPDYGRALTQKQSEAVSDYLTGNHKIQKLGWFSRRKVTAIGVGSDPSPMQEKPPLPVPRVEVIVFIPQA